MRDVVLVEPTVFVDRRTGGVAVELMHNKSNASWELGKIVCAYPGRPVAFRGLRTSQYVSGPELPSFFSLPVASSAAMSDRRFSDIDLHERAD